MKQGALIATLALVLAIGLAMGVNVTPEEQETVTHDFIADITPTVQFTPVEGWSEFDPSSNWTGWGPAGSFGYTANPVANKYKLPQIRVNETVTELTSEQVNALAWTTFSYPPTVRYIQTPDAVYANATLSGADTTASDAMQRLALSELSTVSDLDVEIVLGGPVLVAVPGGSVDYGYTTTIFVDRGYGMADTLSYSAKTATWTGFLDGTAQFYIELTPGLNIYLYRGGSEVSAAPVANGEYTGFSNSVVGAGVPTATGGATVSSFELTKADYIDVTRGITIPVGGTSTITNGYVNGSMEFLVVANGADVLIGDLVTVFAHEDGIAVGVGLNIRQLGTWPAVLVELDAIDGVVRATPVQAFNNFLSYTPSSYSIELPWAGTPASSVTVTVDTAAANLGLVSTTVETDPQGLLWGDPVIDPPMYFPDVTSGPYQLVLRSIAVYGSSLTINGQVLQVVDGDIVVDGESYRLAGMTVDYGDTVELGFPNVRDSPTVDLGPVTSRTISGAGQWYMQVDLRDTEAAVTTSYEYDPDGWTTASGTMVILIFEGLCIAGLLVASRYRDVATTDIVIVVASMVLALMALG